MTALAISKGGLFDCRNKHDNSSIPWFHGDTEFANITCHHKNIDLNKIDFFKIFGTTQTFLGIPVGIPMYWWFRMTYYMTLVSCVFGIVRFLDVGPTRILSKNVGLNVVGSILTCFSVGHALHTKALGLGTGGVIMEIVLTSFGYCKETEGTIVDVTHATGRSLAAIVLLCTLNFHIITVYYFVEVS